MSIDNSLPILFGDAVSSYNPETLSMEAYNSAETPALNWPVVVLRNNCIYHKHN